jgi:hypothetical protein
VIGVLCLRHASVREDEASHVPPRAGRDARDAGARRARGEPRRARLNAPEQALPRCVIARRGRSAKLWYSLTSRLRKILRWVQSLRAPLAGLSLLAGGSLLWLTGHPEDIPLSSEIRGEVTLSNGDAEVASEAHELLRDFAPTFAQEQSPSAPEADTPVRVDFDGDYRATNNWQNLALFGQRLEPAVYGAAVLTRTHAYLTYVLFYPRDWASPFCVAYICHDNDLEAVQLVVERATEGAPARLLYVETKAHFDYVALAGEEIRRDGEGRPILRVESQGHGIYPVARGAALPERARIFTHKDYALLSLHGTLWAHRAHDAAEGELWQSGETGFLAYTGARHGRVGAWLGASMAGTEYAGGVRPPWALRASVGARGDWFLDPAYVALGRHRALFPREREADTSYAFNPYLDDLARECSGSTCAPAPPPPPPGLTASGALGGLLLGLGLVSLRAPRRGFVGYGRSSRRSLEQ